MAWRAARSLLKLHEQLKTLAPRTVKELNGSVWGLIGDAAHNPSSDHTPHNFPGWGSQIVTAADFPNDPGRGLDAHAVLDAIRRSRDPRVKYGISNGEMFSSYPSGKYPAWTWRPYNEPDGHYTHGHLSVAGNVNADGMQPWTITTSTPSTGAEMELNTPLGEPLYTDYNGNDPDPTTKGVTVGQSLAFTQQNSHYAMWAAREAVGIVKGIAAKVDALTARAEPLPGGAIDYERLAAAVADELHRRTAE